ncbi:phospholipase D family protein [Aestuariicella hydrocarbonica]|uniref:Phospholipase D family protein n=1 Tax=Pseudomaricurvus hydrocarbonicus TaxID=1470433 RepID=A0A9E5MPR0_9GAMM|nr:phospholipase D family protein [Aestuariicella hydrocarbonica]NHO68077.1 phospholipase D family protein [Aestuariicella hydrocarbonica]
MTDETLSKLAASLKPLQDQHPGQSGVFPLTAGEDALLARLLLIRAAEKSLDLQYYIWLRDNSGHALIAAVLAAADRGVRVRILLDDVGSPVGDDRLLMLSQHTNIDVCLFNPLGNRAQRLWSMLTNFRRSNRRMHNKSLTVDNTVTVVGGRNIGDEYFDVSDDVAFSDLDLMAVGPVVDQVASSFEEFWQSSACYPIQMLVKKAFSNDELLELMDTIRSYLRDFSLKRSLDQLLELDFSASVTSNKWYWGDAMVLSDSPKKSLLSGFRKSSLLLMKLSKVASRVSRELLLVSPYFVPGIRGMRFFRKLRAKGVQVTIVTNSLSATDVSLVHSGYAKYRKRLLKIGVKLFEIPADSDGLDFARWRRHFQPLNPEKITQFIHKSSRASLHAKAYFIDREKTFVGSMNLDPRSILINTEIGVLVENAELTSVAVDNIKASLQGQAYQLKLDDRSRLVWEIDKNDETVCYYSDPQTSFFRRLGIRLLSALPIEAQL